MDFLVKYCISKRNAQFCNEHIYILLQSFEQKKESKHETGTVAALEMFRPIYV